MAGILLIEPESIVREPIMEILRQRGHEITTASNGREGLALLSIGSPDLIITALDLPHLHGVDVLSHIRANAHSCDVPIIVLTSVAEKSTVVAAVKSHVTAYLLKSTFTLSRFMQYVDAALKAGAQGTPDPAMSLTNSDASGVSSQPGAATAANEQGVIIEAQDTVDPVELLKSIKPIIQRSEMEEQIDQASELRALSPTVSHVIKLTGNPRCSIDHVVNAIKNDHAVALKILKLANSSIYTRGDPVDSVKKAVVRLGTSEVRQAVLNISVLDTFKPDECKGIDAWQFWEHAIACGIIASEIARDTRIEDPESAFTVGLLHDVGRTVLHQQLGERYQEAFDVASRLRLPLDQVEKRMLLFNHADVMDRILRHWGFPKHLINPIALHHLSTANIRKMSPSQVPETCAIALANRLAHAMMLGSSGNDTISPTEDFCETLNISANTIERIEQSAQDQTNDLKFTMLSTTDTGHWPSMAEQWRSQFASSFRPIFISATPAMDAIRIFCGQLHDRLTQEKPNIGVIHLRAARDMIPLTKLYIEAEAKARVSGLPLLLVSAGGQLGLEPGALAGRRVCKLRCPFVIDRFIESTNILCSPEQAQLRKAS